MLSKEQAAIVLAGLQLVAAMPSSPDKSPLSMAKRQGGDGNIGGCKGSSCDDCPIGFWTGSGFPECRIFDTEQLALEGFEVEDNGQTTIFFDVPALDPGCQVIVRTPVVPNDKDCGGNVLVAQGSTCAPVRVDNTFVTLFCCGTGDCAAAGAPIKRDTSINTSKFNTLAGSASGGAQNLHMFGRDGKEIPPAVVGAKKARTISTRDLKKRDCESFKPNGDPYSKTGGNTVVSDTVTCGQTAPCNAQLGESVTETFGVSASVSVGDPLGIVSASVSVSWEESIERSFTGQFEFGEGERGYVVFIPILTCVKGVFEGDCDGGGEEVEVCGPTRSGGELSGDLRAVVIRG